MIAFIDINYSQPGSPVKKLDSMLKIKLISCLPQEDGGDYTYAEAHNSILENLSRD